MEYDIKILKPAKAIHTNYNTVLTNYVVKRLCSEVIQFYKKEINNETL